MAKEFVSQILSNAKQTKEEILSSFVGPLKEQLSHFDIHSEITRILDEYQIEVKATVDFKRKKKNSAKSSAGKS